MSSDQHTRRLDEILLSAGLITEDQVREALELQKHEGSRIGSLLLQLGHISEDELLGALSEQLACRTVALSNIEIPDLILKFIPRRVARARHVLPFDYDTEENVLHVACDSPDDEALRDELSFIARGKKIELYLAVDSLLRDAVQKHYRETKKQSTAELVDEVTDHGGTGEVLQETAESTPGVPLAPARGVVLLVTDDIEADRPIRSLLEADGYVVERCDSAGEAISALAGREYHSVFIRDTVSGDYIDLIDRVRKISPRTRVRYYESGGGLLTDDSDQRDQVALLVKSLDLFTSLLASRDKLPVNHGAIVGSYVDRLCKRMGLPARERWAIVNAAYLHDLARYYYGHGRDDDDYERKLIQLTTKLLDSLNYSPLIVGVLNSMYKDLKGRYQKRLPIEALGGNIVTIVDIFCESVPVHQRLSLDRFDQIATKFRGLVGKLFLEEVTDAFLEMIQDELFSEQEELLFSQVMVLHDNSEVVGGVRHRLSTENFRTICQDSVGQFVELYKRSRPNIIIVIDGGTPDSARGRVRELTEAGVDLHHIPTYLLADPESAPLLTSLLEQGLEDILPLDDNLDLLVAKMKKIRNRLETASTQEVKILQGSGTRGILDDMNLIDLLQAMGPSQKTAKITVQSEQGQLVIYLSRGQIVHAVCGPHAGPEAVYEALGWQTGTWTVEPTKPEALPEPNNQLSNESILMEGCRRLDERGRGDVESMDRTDKLPTQG